MNRTYEYGFVDGSIILTRNFHAIKHQLSSTEYPAEYLLKSFLQSVFKIARESLKCERYFILWDKKPYHKKKILESGVGKSEYKTDRKKESDELVKILGRAKLLSMMIGPKIGLTPVQIPGWEADDLAYLASRQCLDRDKKSVIISFDSDWLSWVGKNTDFYNIKHDSIYTYDRVIETYKPIPGYSLFYSKAIRDSLRGSHNNLKQTVKSAKTPTTKILNDISNNDFSEFTDYKLYVTQLETFNFSKYPDFDKASNFLAEVEYKGSLADVDEFKKLRDKFKLGKLSSKSYSEYLQSLNSDKWISK